MPNPTQPSLTQPAIQLTNTPDYRESYANSVQVRVNVWDFFLVFGTLQQQDETRVEVRNFQGIYLSPQQAKALHTILQQNLVNYENTFGEIKLDPRVQARVTDRFTKLIAESGVLCLTRTKSACHLMVKPNSWMATCAHVSSSPTPSSLPSCFVTHAFLLRLPYFWDEAGYFMPAARDLLLTGSLIPHTTLSNAHPPLVMLWLAFWWKFSAFTPTTTREAMLMVAAFALLGLWRLARTVSTESVAAATVLCTALYPVFFTQSSMAHLDMMAAAFTFWGLAMYVERRPVATIVFFSLAPLAKETAIITPLALMAWELLRPVLNGSRHTRRESWFLYRSAEHALSFLICMAAAAGVVRLPSSPHRLLSR